MGARWPALWRLAQRSGFRIAPRYWFDFAFDLSAAAINSGLGCVESLVYGRRLAKTALPTDPIIILGHWRTGTTLLHELLSIDPLHCAPNTFECLLPVHFLLTEGWLKPWTRFALPKTRGFDGMSVGWDHPQEEELALVNLGIGSPYSQIAYPNEPRRDAKYLDLDELNEVERARWKAGLCRFLRRVLLQRPGRLVLKSPPHTCRIPTLLRLFPQAKFVYVVRDPLAVYPSTIRLWQTLFSAHGYQVPNLAGLEDEVLRTFTHFHERFEQTKSQIATNHLATVRFETLVADPINTLRCLYKDLELGDFEPVAPSLAAFWAQRRDYQPNRHALTADTEGKLRACWQGYFQMHGYA